MSPDYFAEEEPFADFIVHEERTSFTTAERRTIGLRRTRATQWLLDIDFHQRETFAYSCEAYARVVACGKGSRRAKGARSRVRDAAPDCGRARRRRGGSDIVAEGTEPRRSHCRPHPPALTRDTAAASLSIVIVE